MNPFKIVLLVNLCLISATACSEAARTSSTAPGDTNAQVEAPDVDAAQDAKNDATSEVRRNQLNSDIRAREERNNIAGGGTDRVDEDIASEVRSKLEANLPASALTVEAQDGVVTVAGTVPTQQQFDRIDSLAKEIKGVQSVVIKAVVAPAQPQ